MGRKKIKPKKRRDPAPEWMIKWFATGIEPQGKNKPFDEGALECFQLQHPSRREELAELQERYKDEIEQYKRKHNINQS